MTFSRLFLLFPAFFCLAGFVSPGGIGHPSHAAGDEPVVSETLPSANASGGADSAGKYRVKKISNLRYCDFPGGEALAAGSCDVYLPKRKADAAKPETSAGSDSVPDANSEDTDSKNTEESPQRWPVVLVVHGGGWITGNKWTMERHSRQLAERGFAAVSINYRLAPASKFPDQVDDVRSALIWITENAETHSFDTARVGLYGYSAGGHLVSLVATTIDEPWDEVRRTTNWDQEDERWSKIPKIGAVCIGGPPTDFRYLPPDNTTLAFFLGGSRRQLPDIYAAASPICFTSPKDPPFQIIHGEEDGIVPMKNAEDFHRSLVDENVDASLRTLPGKGHLLAFISPKLTDWMLRFFEDKLSER